ncbi:hypothetical protein, partial [Bacillus cereus]
RELYYLKVFLFQSMEIRGVFILKLMGMYSDPYKAILKKYNPGTNKAGREVRSITFFAKDIKEAWNKASDEFEKERESNDTIEVKFI